MRQANQEENGIEELMFEDDLKCSAQARIQLLAKGVVVI